MTRIARFALPLFAAALLLAGCGSSGPTASSVVEELSALYPAPNPRDNTGSCAGDGGCVQLVTTDAVSVYQWPDEATALRFAGDSDAVDVVGPFALSYRGDRQQATSDEARAAYAQRVRELLAAG
jgi:hypothetical protein